MEMERIIERQPMETTQELSNFIHYSFLNYNIMEILGSMARKWNASSKDNQWKQHKNFDKV